MKKIMRKLLAQSLPALRSHLGVVGIIVLMLGVSFDLSAMDVKMGEDVIDVGAEQTGRDAGQVVKNTAQRVRPEALAPEAETKALKPSPAKNAGEAGVVVKQTAEEKAVTEALAQKEDAETALANAEQKHADAGKQLNKSFRFAGPTEQNKAFKTLNNTSSDVTSAKKRVQEATAQLEKVSIKAEKAAKKAAEKAEKAARKAARKRAGHWF